jgi:peptidyl-lysine (3S)-dioxygenase / protease
LDDEKPNDGKDTDTDTDTDTNTDTDDDSVAPPIIPFPFIHQHQKLHDMLLWLGANTLGKLHFDQYDNIMCPINGTKTFTIFHPHMNENLYEGRIREGFLNINDTTGDFSRTELGDSLADVFSPIEITHLMDEGENEVSQQRRQKAFKQYPKFKEARKGAMKCKIRPGNCLFLPAFWWHEVESTVEDGFASIHEHGKANTGDDSLVLAVNFWYEPFIKKHFPCPTCRMHADEQRYEKLIKELMELEEEEEL